MKQLMRRVLRILLRIFWVFPIHNNRIVFQSFNGTEYSDSCKAVVEYLHNQYGEQYDLYWVSKIPSKTYLPDYSELHIIKKHSLRFIYYCLTCQVLICNIVPEQYLPIRKKQKIANTWHGMPYKKIGKYVAGNTNSFSWYNLYMSHNKFYTKQVLNDSFGFYGEILKCGIPRNDILFKRDHQNLHMAICKQYNLPLKYHIALFAPTFRGDFQDANISLNYSKVLQALIDRFGGKWVILFRAHPMLRKSAESFSDVIDVSDYPDMAELLAVSDILLTDYSSSMWDFSLTGRPVLLYTPDIDDYGDERGFYVDMNTLPFPISRDNDELVQKIINFDMNLYKCELKYYMTQMGNYEFGHATESLVEKIQIWCNGDSVQREE